MRLCRLPFLLFPKIYPEKLCPFPLQIQCQRSLALCCPPVAEPCTTAPASWGCCQGATYLPLAQKEV